MKADTTQSIKIAVSHEGSAIVDESGTAESFWLKVEVSMLPEEPENDSQEFRWACLDLLSTLKGICEEHRQQIEFAPPDNDDSDRPDQIDDDPTAGEFPLDPIIIDEDKEDFNLEDL